MLCSHSLLRILGFLAIHDSVKAAPLDLSLLDFYGRSDNSTPAPSPSPSPNSNTSTGINQVSAPPTTRANLQFLLQLIDPHAASRFVAALPHTLTDFGSSDSTLSNKALLDEIDHVFANSDNDHEITGTESWAGTWSQFLIEMGQNVPDSLQQNQIIDEYYDALKNLAPAQMKLLEAYRAINGTQSNIGVKSGSEDDDGESEQVQTQAHLDPLSMHDMEVWANDQFLKHGGKITGSSTGTNYSKEDYHEYLRLNHTLNKIAPQYSELDIAMKAAAQGYLIQNTIQSYPTIGIYNFSMLIAGDPTSSSAPGTSNGNEYGPSWTAEIVKTQVVPEKDAKAFQDELDGDAFEGEDGDTWVAMSVNSQAQPKSTSATSTSVTAEASPGHDAKSSDADAEPNSGVQQKLSTRHKKHRHGHHAHHVSNALQIAAGLSRGKKGKEQKKHHHRSDDTDTFGSVTVHHFPRPRSPSDDADDDLRFVEVAESSSGPRLVARKKHSKEHGHHGKKVSNAFRIAVQGTNGHKSKSKHTRLGLAARDDTTTGSADNHTANATITSSSAQSSSTSSSTTSSISPTNSSTNSSSDPLDDVLDEPTLGTMLLIQFSEGAWINDRDAYIQYAMQHYPELVAKYFGRDERGLGRLGRRWSYGVFVTTYGEADDDEADADDDQGQGKDTNDANTEKDGDGQEDDDDDEEVQTVQLMGLVYNPLDVLKGWKFNGSITENGSTAHNHNDTATS
ncbi:hypothetical protein VKT23_000262 [Stygiomarasmius scandens]|uniref:Uncharacterized protein n=1 Tax=Marasmiellus scandens TaxID=2682957 RepID=A0ABR1K3J8_9AGAR